MASIATALSRIKQDVVDAIKPAAVAQVCVELGYRWRDRELDPATTVALFVQQIIHGNAACTEVPHLSKKNFTASAWCQARGRLPLAVYQALLARVCDAASPATRQAQHRWRGHRTFLLDGSTFSMPDTQELREVFGTPSGQAAGCGFPVAHLLVMFNHGTGLIVDAFASPLYTGDVAQANQYLADLEAGDILIGDDSFSGYAHIALVLQANLHAVVPNHHLRIVDFTPARPYSVLQGKNVVAGLPRSRWIKSLGKGPGDESPGAPDDQLVEWFKPLKCPAWMSHQQYDALPDSIIVREIRRTVRLEDGRRIIVTVVTTLLDPLLYPAEEIIALRLRRWDVETNLGHLKTTMGLDVLRCQTEAGVRKELTVFCLVYNLVRVVMLEAAQRQGVAVARISFIDALRWMRHARAGERLPDLVINPWRPNRIEPRCRKRRPKKYTLMNKPRDALRKLLKKRRKFV